ncbi:MAG: M20/M25/M40 family metallo-hydrolase [bacterium]
MPLTALLSLAMAQQSLPAASPNEAVRDRILRRGYTDLGAYHMLEELCTKVGARLSGSPEAARAVLWAEGTMNKAGFDTVFQVPCMVPHWVRGNVEKATVVGQSGASINAVALGMSPGTSGDGVTAEVIEVHSLQEVADLGDKVKGKIVFYNRPFDVTLPSTFEMYGTAGDQRFAGPGVAGKAGAVGALVRSMSCALDDVPHTGTTNFGDNPAIPSMALGLRSADRLSEMLKKGPVRVNIKLSCQTLPDAPSASVVGEIKGSEKPDEVIVIGGHLDSWDKGQGAHDDGTGVTGAIEALRLIKVLGLKPKRTIRAVAFMNEENGGRGAAAYADMVKKSGLKPYAGIESDSGGFMPRAFGADPEVATQIQSWQPLLRPFGIDYIQTGGGGADIGPLKSLGASLFGLEPADARYFDYHHSDNDTIDKVNPREHEMGAMAMAMLAWLLSEEGLPTK